MDLSESDDTNQYWGIVAIRSNGDACTCCILTLCIKEYDQVDILLNRLWLRQDT